MPLSVSAEWLLKFEAPVDLRLTLSGPHGTVKWHAKEAPFCRTTVADLYKQRQLTRCEGR